MSSMTTGCTTVGATPRAWSRRPPTSAEYETMASWTRAEFLPAFESEPSAYIWTAAGLPSEKRAPKFSGMRSTTSSSVSTIQRRMSASVPSRSVTSSAFSRSCCTRFGAPAALTTVTGVNSSWVATERESASFSTRMKKSGARIGPISRLFTSVRRSRRLSRSSFSITVLIVEIIPAPGSRRSRRRTRPRASRTRTGRGAPPACRRRRRAHDRRSRFRRRERRPPA